MFSIDSGARTILAVVAALGIGCIPRPASSTDAAVSEADLQSGDDLMVNTFHYEIAKEAGKPVDFGPIKRVYVIGPPDAPPIVLLHELPGLRKGDIELGVRLGRSFRVWVPLLFGVAGDENDGKKQACGKGRFDCHSTRASHPILDHLRPLVKRVCEARDCAIIGMCLTGSLPLSLIHDGRVVALVLAQPSLPFPHWWNPFALLHRGIDISESETAAAMKVASARQASVFMIRFHGDPLSSHKSFEALKRRIRPAPGISLTCTEEKGHFLDHSSLIPDKDHPAASDRRFEALVKILDGRLRQPPPPERGVCP